MTPGAEPALADPSVAWGPSPTEAPPPPAGADEVQPPVFGDASAFGKEDWWSRRDFWRLDPGGLGSDVVCDAGTFEDLAVCAASLRGHKHRFQGVPGEDTFTLGVTTTGDGAPYLVACVADGVSSAAQSAHGARQATRHLVSHLMTALRTLEQLPDEVWLADALAAGQAGLIGRSSEEPTVGPAPRGPAAPTSPYDLECTATLAVVPASVAGEVRALVASVGDSPAFVLLEGEWRGVRVDDLADLEDSATVGVYSGTPFVVTGVELSAGDGLLLATDGVGNFVQCGTTTYALGRHLAQQWARPVPVLSFLRDVSFDMASADDDRTALMVWTAR